MMRLFLNLGARILLRLGEHEAQRCQQCERWADEALIRAQIRFDAARTLAERLERLPAA